MAETSAPATVTITVDDVAYEVPAGMLLIDAITDVVGYDMPRFCHHDRLDPVGMCRMCMAEVENRGRWANVATCTMRVMDGMQVRLMSEAAVQARKMTLELLLINHPLDCPVCDKGGECMLQDQTVDDGPEVARTIEDRRKYQKPIPISSMVLLDRERCVHCARCVRMVDEIAGEPTIALINRGYHTEISPAFDGEYDGHFTGNTCDICPVGALTSSTFRFASRPWEMKGLPAISPFDCCGSNLRLDIRENVVRRIMPRENRAVNDCWISDRERFHHAVILDDARLDVPLVRNSDTGELEQASFEDALAAAADGIVKAIEAGQSVAGIGSTILPIEDQYTFQKLMRTVLGSNDITVSHPDDLEARAGLIPTYGELEQAKTFFLGGARPLDELPIAWLRIYKSVRKKGGKLLTLGNRDYLVGLASCFNVDCDRLAEAAIVRGMLGYIYSEKLHNSHAVGARSSGLSDLASTWPTDLDAICAEHGADAARVKQLCHKLAEAEDLVIVAPQSDGRPDGTALRDALWNLALLLNVPGHEHGGWLEYQHNGNSRGAADMGLRPDTLPGYVAVDDAAGRKAYEEAWSTKLPSKAGRDLDALLAAAGELGAMIVTASDLASDEGTPWQTVRNEWLNQSHNGEIRNTFEATWAARKAALEQVPFLVVTELFCSETVKLADVVLPATCFAERDGTYVNLEGRAQFAPAAVRPILGVRSDRSILNALGEALAQRLGKTWTSQDAAATLAEINALVPGYGEATREAMAGEGVLINGVLGDGKFSFVALD